jgi:TonB-linked SusC/RagA family outer membrane protein
LWLKLGTEIEPVKGWKTDIAYNYNLGSSSISKNPHPVPVIIPNGTIGNIGTSTAGSVENLGLTNYFIFNALTSYEKGIGDHFIKGMVGYEQELSTYKSLYGSRMGLISELVPSINAAVGESTLGANSGHWATQAVFGRLNYNFREKYLLEASGRYNGSSRFAKDSRWGFFPSVSAGYNISKEDFWSAIEPYVNTLKLRASYGSLGNQNVPNYLYMSTIPVYSNLGYVIDNSRPIYAQVPNIISSNLTWETVTTLNFGVDAGFLNNRLGVAFDVYNRKTSNMFGPAMDLPSVLGTYAPFENNAELATKGFEVSLDWKDRISPDLSYNVKVSVGDSKSSILKYKNDDKVIDNWYEGQKYGEIWGFETDGLIQKAGEPMADQSKYYTSWGPGDMKYKDLDGDNIISEGKRTLKDHGDLRVIGNSASRYNIVISGGVNWKAFSLNMIWQGVGKRDYMPNYDANVFYGIVPGGKPGSESSIMKGSPALDYWRPADETNFLGPNTNAYFPKPYFTDEFWKNHMDQSRYVLNAAYLRLKNLQIGYTLPHNISRKAFIERARIYVSGENLITLTKLPKVLDPETAFASDSRLGGLEPVSAIYPISRILSCGINLTF